MHCHAVWRPHEFQIRFSEPKESLVFAATTYNREVLRCLGVVIPIVREIIRQTIFQCDFVELLDEASLKTLLRVGTLILNELCYELCLLFEDLSHSVAQRLSVRV